MFLSNLFGVDHLFGDLPHSLGVLLRHSAGVRFVLYMGVCMLLENESGNKQAEHPHSSDRDGIPWSFFLYNEVRGGWEGLHQALLFIFVFCPLYAFLLPCVPSV